jgi:methionine-rich copper-binding protein CopC
VRNRSTIVAVAALAAALLTSISAAASAPYLRSAAASRGHVVAVFTLDAEGDAVADHIAVAVSLATQTDGSFLPAKVRVQEAILGATQTANGMRVRTQHKLRPGRYYVKVSSKALALDCTPKNPCKELWSNARRVVIPRP